MAKISKIEHTKNALIEAMHKSLGIVTRACEIVGITRATFYKYYNEDADFREQCNSIQDVALDYVESELFKKIKGGDTTAIIFYLKTKGKNRGYVERKENLDLDSKQVNIPLQKWVEDAESEEVDDEDE